MRFFERAVSNIAPAKAIGLESSASMRRSVKVGSPLVPGSKVEAKVVAQGRGSKIMIVKFKRRKNYKRVKGHRQHFTEVEIVSITEEAKKKAAKPKKKTAKPKKSSEAQKASGKE